MNCHERYAKIFVIGTILSKCTMPSYSTIYICESCSFQADSPDEIEDSMNCPDCGGNITTREND